MKMPDTVTIERTADGFRVLTEAAVRAETALRAFGEEWIRVTLHVRLYEYEPPPAWAVGW